MISNRQLLEAAGLLRGDWLNIPLLQALLDAAMEHPQAGEILLKRFASRYKSEFQELLTQSLLRIELRWSWGSRGGSWRGRAGP